METLLVADSNDADGAAAPGGERRIRKRRQRARHGVHGEAADSVIHFVGDEQEAAGRIESHAKGMLAGGGRIGDWGERAIAQAEREHAIFSHAGYVGEPRRRVDGHAKRMQWIVVAGDRAAALLSRWTPYSSQGTIRRIEVER